jgi:hypothetical protein
LRTQQGRLGKLRIMTVLRAQVAASLGGPRSVGSISDHPVEEAD